MQAELFSKLREYSSLDRMRIDHLRRLSEHDNRLSHLQQRLQDDILQTEKLKHEHTALKQELGSLDQKIKMLQEQKDRLRDLGGDEKKIAQYAHQLAEAEDRGLELLTLLETNEQELQDRKTFQQGLRKTLSEIELEVTQEKEKENQSIASLQQRLEALEGELPEDFRHTLRRVMSKNLAHGAFTRIEAGSCYFCRFKLSRVEESEIDAQKLLKLCPQCSRIFLPYGT